MIIFALKTFKNLRKAIAGRRYPHQLAGAVALGVLLGIIPHGNLIALAVLLFVLCCNVNHAMLALVTIGVTFVAARLDPFSHSVGQYVLGHESIAPLIEKAWSVPLVPWTDLNNTVVMGSLLIGLAATAPTFLITLPMFKAFKPTDLEESEGDESNEEAQETAKETKDELAPTTAVQPLIAANSDEADASDEDQVFSTKEEFDEIETEPEDSIASEEQPTESSGETKHSIMFVHQPHETQPPRFSAPPAPATPDSDSVPFDTDDFLASEEAIAEKRASELAEEAATTESENETESAEQLVSVDTRIDVIRLKPQASDSAKTNDANDEETEQPMDEALSYLLRQLRNSQQRKAAG